MMKILKEYIFILKKILKVSIDLHGRKAMEREVLVDTTVQEKNITFPTDTKLYKRIIEHCVGIANKERITLRQSYRRTTKKLLLAQRFRNHPKNRKKARAAQSPPGRRRLPCLPGASCPLREVMRWSLPKARGRAGSKTWPFCLESAHILDCSKASLSQPGYRSWCSRA